MANLNLQWIGIGDDRLLLDHQRFNLASIAGWSGVYVIYLAGNPPKTIYVGSGDIPERLACHKDDVRIKRFANRRIIFAAVPAPYQLGVEAHLARVLAPLVGDRHPAVREISVNLPFAA